MVTLSRTRAVWLCAVIMCLGGATRAQAQERGAGTTGAKGEAATGKTAAKAPASGSAEDGARLIRVAPGAPRPTIQRRFAPKARLLYLHGSVLTHVRDDFYDSWGFGGDVGYFLNETLGVELRVWKLQTSLDDAAVDLKERFGITPDARPQDWWFHAGVRYAPGYGKILMWDSFVVHFDPQLALHGGVANAEARWLPSFQAAMSLFMHFRWGIKAKVDLGVSVQGEKRDRGWVWTTGFAPSLGLGWGINL